MRKMIVSFIGIYKYLLAFQKIDNIFVVHFVIFVAGI